MKIYYLLLLMAILICIWGIYFTFKAPKKVKVLFSFIMVLMLSKFLTLYLMMVKVSINYIYYFKYIVFIDVPTIFTLFFISIYIFTKKGKLAIPHIWIIFLSSMILYTVFIVNLKLNIIYDDKFGYILNMGANKRLFFIYLIEYTILFIISLLLMGKRCRYKISMIIIMLISALAIGEVTYVYMGMYALPYNIISTILYLFLNMITIKRISK